MKVFVGFRYLSDNFTQPLAVFETKEAAIKWEKQRWNNGWVELEVDNGPRQHP